MNEFILNQMYWLWFLFRVKETRADLQIFKQPHKDPQFMRPNKKKKKTRELDYKSCICFQPAINSPQRNACCKGILLWKSLWSRCFFKLKAACWLKENTGRKQREASTGLGWTLSHSLGRMEIRKQPGRRDLSPEKLDNLQSCATAAADPPSPPAASGPLLIAEPNPFG